MSLEPYYQDEHSTIYCGDCRDIMPSLDCDVIVTDPPYGMALRSSMGGAFGSCEVLGDESLDARDDALRNWDGPAIVFGRWSEPKPAGTRMVLTWEKGEHVGMGDLALPWKPNTEEIYILGSGFTGHRGSSVLHHLAIAGTVGRADQGTRHHPTEKPVNLLRELIGKCPPGVVLDPFMGSGTTLQAAKDLGRRAIGIELSEQYCQVAVNKLAQGVLFA